MFVTSYSVTYCAYIKENRDFVFIIIVQFMMSSNSRIRFGLQIVFVCLYITSSHYHQCANLSEDIELIKLPVGYVLSSVWVRFSIFSQLSIMPYMGLCVFSLPIPLVMIESMNYSQLFGVRSWNNGMRSMSLYILIKQGALLLTCINFNPSM